MKYVKKNKYSDFIAYRSPLKHTYDCLTKDKKINIVYFGGSITAGYGSSNFESKSWRALSVKWFRENFPDAEINDVKAAIGESGSYLGVFRLKRDVLSQKPDLVFIEFAINDYFHGATQEIAENQFETIVREIKRAYPLCDIVTIITECDETAYSINLYPAAIAHETISYAYEIPSLRVGQALIKLNNVTTEEEWRKYIIDNAHPSDAGYEEYYNCVEEFLHNSLLCSDIEHEKLKYKPLPNICAKELVDGDREFVTCNEAFLKNATEFFYADEIFNNLPKTPYKGCIYTNSPDAEFSYEFFGTEMAMYSNFRSGTTVKVSVDGEEYTEINCSETNPSMLCKGLEPGTHAVKIMPVFKENGPDIFKLIGIMTRNDSKSGKRYTRGTTFIPKNKEEFFLQESLPVTQYKIGDTITYKKQFLSNGVMCWRVYIDAINTGKELDIMHIADTHLNHINQQDFDENNPVVVSTLENRKGFKEVCTFFNLEAVMSYANVFDKLVVSGDVMDYLTHGALEYVQKYIYDKRPDALLAVGGHDRMRRMQGRVPDESSIESRYDILRTVWRNDVFYHSEVLENRVMLVVLNNGEGKYYDFQLEKFMADVKKARENGWIILIFQHEPISTMNPRDVYVEPIWRCKEELPRNYYRELIGNNEKKDDKITKAMHTFICENADVIKGLFCGHHHSDVYTEVKASYIENGVKHDSVIPQYMTAAVPYHNGHMMVITVR